MTKNFSRSLLVLISIAFTLALGHKVEKFLGILGAICCAPIGFTFPALFHLKVAAKTKF